MYYYIRFDAKIDGLKQTMKQFLLDVSLQVNSNITKSFTNFNNAKRQICN